MKYYRVGKTENLVGEISVQGSKNSVLPIIAATVTIKDIVTIKNCPNISDVWDMLKLLEKLNVQTCFMDNTLYIDATNAENVPLNQEEMSKTRGGILLLGALVSRFGQAQIAYPGGCVIGSRPIDIHLEGMESMNVAISADLACIEAYTERVKGTDIILRYPSVGATENLMILATMAKGVTVLQNVAREPEVVELQDFLNKAGANITGAGTDCIIIKGVKSLHKCRCSIIGDRMVAATYMAATAAVGGKVRLDNVSGGYLRSEIACFRRMGCYVKVKKNSIYIARDVKRKLRALPLVELEPYPGVATDAGTVLAVALLQADGISVLKDKVFENRYKVAIELQKLGAVATVIKGRVVVICGNEDLAGSKVVASDLRGGAALVIAGLLAEGSTEISGVEYICRGYEDIVRDLRLLGADITEESWNDEEEQDKAGADITSNSLYSSDSSHVLQG